jgi:membrane glycosyltransferase
MAKRTNIISEFFMFMRERKAFWMAPIIIGLLLLALLVVLGNGAGAPFIYTLF